jgi:uncharacterized protein YdaL
MITNPKSIPSDFKTIRGNIVVKNYLNKKGIPFLNVDKGVYLFSENPTRFYLIRAPFYIKAIIKLMNKK